jgi:hypothetical protein
LAALGAVYIASVAVMGLSAEDRLVLSAVRRRLVTAR